jgi:hypothetical protein
MENPMNNKRTVHKLLSVFDILNYRSILLPNRSSIRVLFQYDAENKRADFTILSAGISQDICKLLVETLKQNVSSDKIIYGLDANTLDYGDIGRAASH